VFSLKVPPFHMKLLGKFNGIIMLVKSVFSLTWTSLVLYIEHTFITGNKNEFDYASRIEKSARC